MRIIYAIIVGILTVTTPWYIVLPIWICYAFVYPAYELLAFGIIFDAAVGSTGMHLYYTATALALVLLMEWIKPNLSFHDK